MSRLALFACAPLLLLAACGAKPGMETGTDTASLIRGSWTCSFAGKDITTGESASGTFSVTYVSDGTWAASGEWKSKVEGKSAELGVVSRGTWAVADSKLEEKTTYEAATWAKLGGEVFDHGEYNRAVAIYFRENPTLDPLKVTSVTAFSELTADTMIGADQDGYSSTCERAKT